jgi:hypothetical protein
MGTPKKINGKRQAGKYQDWEWIEQKFDKDYLFNNVCFDCRKKYNNQMKEKPEFCPIHKTELTCLGCCIKTPKKTNVKAWKKLEKQFTWKK